MFGRAAVSFGWAFALCVACGAAERNPSEGSGGSASQGGGGAASGGGATSGGASPASGGVSAQGGASSGGLATGGSTTGGTASSGSSAGGKAAGGSSAGGSSSGGTSSGGGSAGSSAESGMGGDVSAGAGGEAGGPSLCGDYVACGCGCCGVGPTEVGRCYYPEAGDKLSDIIASDQMQRGGAGCATAGCSAGLRHACCMSGNPDPVSFASYSAALNSTALDRLSIAKTGTDGRCARIIFAAPLAMSTVYTALELPDGGWAMESAYEAPCAMSANPPGAIGAIGTMKLRTAGSSCVIDVHLTTFFARNGQVQGVPFDADGLTFDGLGLSLCQ